MVQSGFYAWSAVALAMIFPLLKFSERRKHLFLAYAVFLSVWLLYIVVIARSGVLADFSLPPRVPLLVVIPAIAAAIVITGRSNFKEVLRQTPLHWPVYMQSFRIMVELLIYGAFVDGVFPERVTFKGLNYDILSGLSAPVVAYLYQRGSISGMTLLVWNVIAMVILGATVYSFASTYYFSDYLATSGSADFVRLPYLLLAAVLLPVAVFLHVFSLRQLKLRQGNVRTIGSKAPNR
jgi:hypothetical protein